MLGTLRRRRHAEAIRKVLRQIGAREWVGRRIGFVVDGTGDPFRIAVPHCNDPAEANAELHRYSQALTHAGYTTKHDNHRDHTPVLYLWPPNRPQYFPPPAGRNVND